MFASLSSLLRKPLAKKKQQYPRQLARVLVAETSEIITPALSPGNTLSRTVFKERVYKMEHYLELETKVKKKQIKRRIDAGFGTAEKLNFALWRGYHILAKVYSGKRAKKPAKSVTEWFPVPSEAETTEREAGWVTSPHRYCRKTVQVAVRTKTDKGGYSCSVLVTTQMDASLAFLVTEYDKRGGMPEIILPGLSRNLFKEKA